MAGHIPVEFLQLPEEVLTTTMIHHQHYFPVVGDDGKLKPAFLAVINMQPEKPEIIARNSERVLTARLRDARFFWDADRSARLDSRLDRLATILFHKKLGSYREKADRVSELAAWMAGGPRSGDAQDHARQAGLLCKADLATDMVRELTELQGTMGGIYAREDGLPEAVWKAIYYHYLPVGVEADAPPTRKQLGAAAVTWAAVSLADKLDSVVGMFAAGERPTGSRDPLGLRRQAQGVVRVLADLPQLTGLETRVIFKTLVDQAGDAVESVGRGAPGDRHVPHRADPLSVRAARVRHPRRACRGSGGSRREPRRGAREARRAGAAGRLAKSCWAWRRSSSGSRTSRRTCRAAARFRRAVLKEPAETALADALAQRQATIATAVDRRDYRAAFATIGALRPTVATFSTTCW